MKKKTDAEVYLASFDEVNEYGNISGYIADFLNDNDGKKVRQYSIHDDGYIIIVENDTEETGKPERPSRRPDK